MSVLVLGLSAILCALLGLMLGAGGVLSPVASLHLIFAVGVLPLIFGAMLHFVPVLTRSAAPHRCVAAIPFLAQGVGLLVVAGMQGIVAYRLLHAAAGLDLILAACLLAWIVLRARKALGNPHPGWRWYVASLALLCLALASIPFFLSGFAPLAARNLHLHANTLGFIGLAALGTLPVLMPTVLSRSDPQAAHWLQRYVLPASMSVVLLSFGAGFSALMSLAGALGLLWVTVSLLRQWQRMFGLLALFSDGVSVGLTAALSALGMLLLAGGLHAVPAVSAIGMVPAFVSAFLLPLVTSALSQLLPVWRFPGAVTPRRLSMRQTMARGGEARASLFIAAGGSFIVGAQQTGAALTLVAFLWFVCLSGVALRAASPAR